MIALDTSSLVHYLAGSTGKDVDAVDAALAQSQACLPPVVLSEVLSDPTLPQKLEQALLQIPVLPLKPRYWQRAGDEAIDVRSPARSSGPLRNGGVSCRISLMIYCIE